MAKQRNPEKLADRGVVIGKFHPPHRGHLELIEFASRLVDELTVVVCSLPDESIAGTTRVEWMRELCPGAEICHLDEILPSEPKEDANFWSMWQRALRGCLGRPVDIVFASENYGVRLAEALDARFMPCDLERSAIPISASEIRAAPLKNWSYLPACVRAHYLAKVCVFGPESTGKSTLAADLAEKFSSVHVPEFARTWLELRGGELVESDLQVIAKGQHARMHSLRRVANRVLICDTDVLSTQIWAQRLYGRCDPGIIELAEMNHADHYLLCDVDVPWVADSVRYLPDDRRGFFDQFERALVDRGLSYTRISGDWPQRTRAAVAALRARWPILSCGA